MQRGHDANLTNPVVFYNLQPWTADFVAPSMGADLPKISTNAILGPFEFLIQSKTTEKPYMTLRTSCAFGCFGWYQNPPNRCFVFDG